MQWKHASKNLRVCNKKAEDKDDCLWPKILIIILEKYGNLTKKLSSVIIGRVTNLTTL